MSTAPAHALTERLKKLTRGLSFQSESDYPVQLFFAEGGGRKSIKASDLSEQPGKQVDFDGFFGTATADEVWHGPEEKESARRFRELVEALKETLADIKVYKVGKASGAEFDIYVVGRTADGDFAGVTTKVVET
jgi:hypothetical protein